MEFLKTHRKSLIIGAVAFAIGFVVGEVWQARSFNQKMANNIFNQVTGQQSQMRQSREDSQRRFAAQRKKSRIEMENVNRAIKEAIRREHKAFQKKLRKRSPPTTGFNGKPLNAKPVSEQ